MNKVKEKKIECKCHCHCECGGYHQKDSLFYEIWSCEHCSPSPTKGKIECPCLCHRAHLTKCLDCLSFHSASTPYENLKPKSPSPTKEWEKELKNISVTIQSPDGDGSYAESIEDINEFKELKSFISSLLKEQRAELIEEIERLIRVFDKHKDEPMTGNVVNLELRVVLDSLKLKLEGKK